MKKITLLLLLSIISLNANNNFEKRKDIIIKIMEKRIGIIKNNINCIKQSKNKKEIKICREKNKVQHKSLKEERKMILTSLKKKK